ncbi:discoidin domain-containing protein [Parabacteroides sp. Marseille-P3160]|uniref:discoidin domain-containing protein n=1 Tax=Parabacteroides sp. Marseille-P3160 TaxID=1917887 RepID=UPI0009BB7BF6|nr:discoidin domain-containing protein [Parabacteroides sp. Marseille-P3160]
MIKKTYTLLVILISIFLFVQCSDDNNDPSTPLDPEPENPIEQKDGNLAIGGQASSSSANEGRGASFLIDGKIENNVNEGYYSSVGTSENHTEWIQIDMKKVYEINEVWIYPRYDGTHDGFPVDYNIQVSEDGSSWKKVFTKEGEGTPKNALPLKCSFENTKAKYVKVEMTKLSAVANEWTNWNNSYIVQLSEIEIYRRTQAVKTILLNTYFSDQAPMDLKVAVETERIPDGTRFVAELIRHSDKQPLPNAIKKEGTINKNKADITLTLPESIADDSYLVKIEFVNDEDTPAEYSDKFVFASVGNKTYYVSSSKGNDQNDGLSEEKPFKTLSKASQTALKPGTKILLKAGDAWANDNLLLEGSGTKQNPIIIASYGSGARPIISPSFDKTYGIRIVNGSGYEIKGIEVRNCYGGIVFWFENTYNHEYILIEDCYLNFISGTSTGFGGGWDQVMPVDMVMPTGIIINGSDNYGDSRICEDITIRNSKFDRCDVGIMIISRDHDSSGEWKYHGKDKTSPNNFNNIKISDCNVTRSFRTGGICLSCVSDVHATDVLVDETGYNGVGMYWGVAAFQVSRVKNVLVENSTFSNTIKGNSPDGQGFDFEADCTNVTVKNCRFINNDGSGTLCYGESWPGVNTNNVIDGCYFEGNNRVEDNRIFNIGKPANNGSVKNSTIKMSNLATTFYSYPLAFDESNRVYNANGQLIYAGGPSRDNPMLSDDFSKDLSKWENANNASVSGGKLSINKGKYIYAKNSSSWKNYFIETELKGTTQTGVAGIIFHVSADGKNYYMAKVNLRDNYRSDIDIVKVTNGTESTSFAKFSCQSMLQNTDYKIRIEIKDSVVSVYLIGNLLGTYTNSALTGGSAGFSVGDGDFVFDNVLVCPL